MSRLDRGVNLQTLMRELAATASCPLPDRVEVRLRAACRQRQLRRGFRIGALGLAATLLLTLGWMWHSFGHPPAPADQTYAGFLALPYAQSDVPMEQTIVVRVNLQPADLRSLGLPATAMSRKSRIKADLLIGQDGIARAVRLTE